MKKRRRISSENGSSDTDEIKAAVNEISLNRDSKLENKQLHMGKSIAALGKAQTTLLSMQKEEGGDKLLPVIEAVNDAARIIADIHHEQSLSRQNIISVTLDRTVKDLLQKTTLDGWLFGEKLGERIKAAKAIQRSGQELKTQQKTSILKGKARASTKNWKTPPRRARASGGKKYQTTPRSVTSGRTGQHARYESKRRQRREHFHY